jgi:hypothetical protein
MDFVMSKAIIVDLTLYTKHNTNKLNPLMLNDLQRRCTVSPLKLISPVKICLKKQQIHQLFIQFINYVW